MSVTTGTGAKKTAGTDNWRTIISVHDDTVDVYDKVKAAAAIFAAPYDSTATYAAGDQCTHDGRWYVANQAISTAEDWTAAHWTEITIASKLDTANVYNGLDKTASGFALDARQGKLLNEAIAQFQGIEIAANTNLDTLTTPGEYYSGNSTRTATLSNCPVSGMGFSMIVLKSGTSAPSQLIVDASGGVYSRGYSSGSFSNWINYCNGISRVTETYNNVVIPSGGYVKFETFSNIISSHSSLSLGWYLMSMTIRGWSTAILPVTLLKGSNGTDFYIAGTPQTIGSMTIEYFFANPATTKSL